MPDGLLPRMDLLERLQAQQETLNALLIEVAARLSIEQAAHDHEVSLHAERLARADAILARLGEASAHHETHLAELRQILAAIKDMLDRGNGS